MSSTQARRVLVSMVGLFCLAALPAFAQQQWSDGTEITRFDKRPDAAMESVADFTGLIDRRWPGPSLWANRLQDWRVVNDNLGGWLQTDSAGSLPCRTAHVLTYDLCEKREPFRLEMVLRVSGTQAGFAGFLVGAGEGRLDYRGAALVHHMPGQGGGLLAVVETTGEGGLSFRDMSQPETTLAFPPLEGQKTLAQQPIRLDYHQMMLNLEGVPGEGEAYDLRLSVWARHSGELLGAQELRGVPASRLRGNVALVAHPEGKPVRHLFGALRAGGGRLAAHPERAFGPVAGTLYTVANGTLKLPAQFMSYGQAALSAPGKGRKRGARLYASLEARPLGSTEAFRQVAGPITLSPPDYYVPFRIEGWDATRDWETRVLFTDERDEEHAYTTVVRRDPTAKPRVSVAGFTGMGVMGRTANAPGPKPEAGEVVIGRWTPANVWMPFAETVSMVQKQDVDLLFFTGDQIYEGKPTPPDGGREPFEDYLYKWILWHWSFRDLTDHLPAVCQPDDHDVYHGNLWGWGGRLNLTGSNSEGGYLCSPYFVNMVHRTQTGHMPDPYDAAPALNGISNYYGAFTYGGVGFAVLEDRKFKTPPQVQDPEEQELLGKKQLQFLREWGEDWRGHVLKCAVSQTIYAAMHTDFQGGMPKDPDAGGFPKGERDKAVRLFRRAGIFVLSGDQHLATFTRVGIDAPGDGVYNFAVPALGNIFWRWFYPSTPGAGRAAGEPEHLGEFTDAWGNPFRMIAVANPERQELLSQKLRSRSVLPEAEAKAQGGVIVDSAGVKVAVASPHVCLGDGYGIVRFDKGARTVTVECWPYSADPTAGGKPFAGWPVTIPEGDLDGRKPVAWLPEVVVDGCDDAVVKVMDQATGEVVKVTRIQGKRYRAGVFDAKAKYALHIGRPEAPEAWRKVENLRPGPREGGRPISVRLGK